jgi:hypothetical protein
MIRNFIFLRGRIFYTWEERSVDSSMAVLMQLGEVDALY